jgi:hypothetical protein
MNAPPPAAHWPRWALPAHVASVAGCLAFWAYLGRHLWFFGDEWQFLVARGTGYSPGDPRSIWYPHLGHWSTLPILLWRGLYTLFHFGSYWPYFCALLVVVAAVLHLIWRICERDALSPLLSLAAVSVVGLLGPGAEDLGWAFQVGFMGSIAFGLAALLLADRGQMSRQAKLLVSGCALASLMCSTVGDAMLVALAIVLARRQPLGQVATVLALPLSSYAIWWAALGHRGLGQAGHLGATSVTALPGYVWTGLSTALGRSFNLEAAGAAILVALAAWCLWALRPLFMDRPAVLALGAAAVCFYVLAGLGRDTAGDIGSTSPRYIFVGFALLAPLIVAGLSSPFSLPAQSAAAALLVLTALGDAGQAQAWAASRTSLVQGLGSEIHATAALLAGGARTVVSPTAAPIGYSPDLTVAQLARLGHSGLLGPHPASPAAWLNARAALQVGVSKQPLFNGSFTVIGASAAGAPGRPGCLGLRPLSPLSTMDLALRARPGHPASVLVSVGPPPPSGGALALEAILVQARARARSTPEALPLVAGRQYIDDAAPAAVLELEWRGDLAITFCGLQGVAGHGAA